MAKRKEVEQQAEEMQAKVASLEDQIRSLQGQLQGLQQQAQAHEQEKHDLQQQIGQYRSRESAIVLAITDAREAGSRKLKEAQEQARKIIANAQEDAKRTLLDANRQARELEKKAKSAELDANRRAQKLVDDVQADISRKFHQIESDLEDFYARLEKLNITLNDAVEQARQQAEGFASALKDLLFETDELSAQGKGLSALIDEKQELTPKEYGSAAQFMHDIYKLQGRDLPAPEEETPEDVSSAGTFSESDQFRMPSRPPEPQGYAPPEPQGYAPPEPQGYRPPEPQSYAPPEPQGYAPPEPQGYRPPEPGAYQPEPAAQRQEERVWTVDEIIAGHTPTPKPSGSGAQSIDLDSLLDEIMN